tara:strand:+ start:7097 stop:7783 length:687 start_codon:yes stop_codon:yes gene_type:complete
MINTKKYGEIFNLLKDKTGYYWLNYTNHKFVKKLSKGSLNKSLYINYLIQDYIFLINFSRAWALLIVKSNSMSEMRIAADTVNNLINKEIQLHIETCLSEGISEEKLFSSEEELNNLAYTRYVLEAGYSGDFLDLLVTLSPCIFGYGEIGKKLINETKIDNPYNDWIKVYSGNDYQNLCINIGKMLDKAIYDRLGKNFKKHSKWSTLENKFLMATKLEINFWEMSIKQ